MKEENIKMEKLPNYGEHMTVRKFISYVKSGCFIDYDGYGNYATKSQMSNISVYPSEIERGEVNKNFTHIVWFNR